MLSESEKLGMDATVCRPDESSNRVNRLSFDIRNDCGTKWQAYDIDSNPSFLLLIVCGKSIRADLP